MSEQKIPQIIHYCWFGHNKKSGEIIACIESWKKYFPDWDIIEWNESNYDVTKVPYMEDAYQLKKWAFVSDYARLDILYQYGGIYLDVDVEFIKPLPYEYPQLDGFCGFEGSMEVNPGLIFGIKPKCELLRLVMESYQNEHFTYQKNALPL